MKKVIVKSLLNDRQRFERRAERTGLGFEPTVRRHERVFLPSNFQPKMGYARIILWTEQVGEEQPEVYTLELRRHLEDEGTDLVERTTVDDPAATAAMLTQMGYVPVAELMIERQAFELDENTVFYLDALEGVNGSFLKIETTLTEEDDEPAKIEALRNEMLETLSLLGQETIVAQTYEELMQQKK